MSAVLEAVPPKQLDKGVPVEVHLPLGQEWCRRFFELSGDVNFSLHSESGRRIVQGLAILTQLGTAVSKHMPGFMVLRIGEVAFKKPVFIGETLCLRMTRLDDRTRLTRLEATIVRDEEELSKVEILLGSERMLDRQ